MVTMDIKLLAEGQLPDVKTTLYTCPVGRTVIIKTVSYVNTTTALSVNLYLKKSGSVSRKIIPSDMLLGERHKLEHDDEISLAAGDEIEGDASVAAKIDYTISGVEKF